ncbi:hypothetical protein Mpsy_1300 [Methanolobus psychrophilus R15]|nr:hypothetical protein Mpsy_1300 [Methanolobus psychrophilus R15]
MTTIGVITRGKYGRRLIETLLAKTALDVIHTSVPEQLPGFIDEPEGFLSDLALDDAVFRSDIVITYSLHPDLTAAIAQKAGKDGARALIVPGGASKAPVKELEHISEKYGMYIEVEDICCTLSDNPAIYDFSSKLASPILDIETDNGKVSHVRVIRGAPCGSTWQMAKELIGTKIEDAPARAGLLIQQYPCRAVRGTLGGIHQSAEMHKNAVEKALDQNKRRNISR